MEDSTFEAQLADALETYFADELDAPVRTFEEAGVMTNNCGLVVCIAGTEFQLTVAS